jgi:hypothetical protein
MDVPSGGELPKSPQELCQLIIVNVRRILHTCYMGTDNSSRETRHRSKDLASNIGSYHIDMNIDLIIGSFLSLFETVTGMYSVFKVRKKADFQTFWRFKYRKSRVTKCPGSITNGYLLPFCTVVAMGARI